MNLLAPIGLLLLAALPVLVWLAMRASRPRVVEVGTLLIWRRVAKAAAASTQTRRRRDPLLYVLLAACALGAFGAARPAKVESAPTPVLAVYIERLGSDEPELSGVFERARELAAGARVRVWFSGDGALVEELGTVQTLNPAPPAAELAQFETASGESAARLMFLCESSPEAERLGLVLPRVTAARAGVIFEIRSELEQLSVRASQGPPPKVEGASLLGVRTQGREFVREYEARASIVRLSSGAQRYELARNPLVLGVGDDWNTPRHAALAKALQPAGEGKPEFWLGGKELAPALRINQGQPADLQGLELQFDWQHPLFRELPLNGLDLSTSARLMEPAAGHRALCHATRDGKPVGELITLSADGRVLRFAGDPFADCSVTVAALLLDNAVGVITGRRPSARPLYEMQMADLPTRRQAMAAPFEPAGELRFSETEPEIEPWGHWLLIAAALCALAAMGLSLRDKTTATGPHPRG